MSRNVKDLRHGLDPLKKLHAALHIFHSRVIVAFGIAHLRSLLKFLCSRTQFEARTVGAKEKKAWLQQCMTLLSAFTCDFSRQHNRNPAAIALRSARNPALFGLDFTDAECKTSLGGLVCQAFSVVLKQLQAHEFRSSWSFGVIWKGVNLLNHGSDEILHSFVI